MMQKIANAVRRFGKKEDGLVTVEWVSLAAAVVVGGIAIAWMILNAVHGSGVDTKIGTAQANAAGQTVTPPSWLNNPGG